MQYQQFGRLNWNVSRIGFGAWAIGAAHWGNQRDEDSLAALHRALDLGVTFIDTAQGYGDGHSERIIAKVLGERGQRGGGGPIRVATKIPPTDGHWPPLPNDSCEERYPPEYLRERTERSLRDLNAEVLDVVQLHTWTRAWNSNPTALEVLRDLQKEGKIIGIGISTPEHDQNSLIELMRNGWLDAVQVIYNIFEQEPAAEFLPTALEHDVGVIVRVVFDEGSLTGKFAPETTFPDGDFRQTYFKGDRLQHTLAHVEGVRKTLAKHPEGKDGMASAAVRFALAHPAVSTVITGIRTVEQAELNCAVADHPPLSADLMQDLYQHIWRRAFWHGT